ncbi:hypothetical protein ACFL1Q_00900 [Patescibacteria group bacterium]
MDRSIPRGGFLNQDADRITNPAFGATLKNWSLSSRGGITFFQKILPNLISLAFIIAVLIFFFVLIIAAIQWISSGGDKTAMESARGRITSALVGIVILLSSFALIKIVEAFFGINILTLDIGILKIQ